MKTKQIVLIVIVLALSLMAFAPTEPASPLIELLTGIAQLAASLLILGLGTERGTQIVKELLRSFKSYIPWLDLTNRKSFILAAGIAFAVSYFFNVDVTQYLKLLDGFDPELIKLVNALLLTLVSNKVHDNFFKSTNAADSWKLPNNSKDYTPANTTGKG